MSFLCQRLPALVSEERECSNGEEPDPSSSEAHRIEGINSMSRSTTSRTVPAILAAAVLLSAVAVAATGVFGRTVTPTPEPTDPPIVEPSAPPTAPPSAPPNTPPSDEPSSPPADVFVVDLDTADQHDVTAVIDDETGSVVGAASGQAGDGMSVRWNTIRIDAVDADSVALTWAGWLQDEVIDVVVAKGGVGYVVTFTQKLPYPNTDAMGADRVLVIDFESAVDPSDIEADFIAAS
jgi:hypothetical protein